MLRFTMIVISRTALIGSRLKRRYFDVLRLAVLAGRQPACVRRTVNHTNCHPFQVRKSFAGRDLCLGKAKPQGDPLWIAEDFNAAQVQISPSKPGSN